MGVVVGEVGAGASDLVGLFSGTTISFDLDVSAPAGTGRAVGKGVVIKSTTSSGNRPVNWPGRAQIKRGNNNQPTTSTINDANTKARAARDPLFMPLFDTPCAAFLGYE